MRRSSALTLEIFLFQVFDHTEEQYNNLLKAKALITVTSWWQSKTCLTRLICARLDTQDEVVFKTWSSKVSWGIEQPQGLLPRIQERDLSLVEKF